MSSRERALVEAAACVAPLPACADAPVFAAPWEAQAFAMTLALHERGAFGWDEWAQALGQAIRDAQAAGDPDDGSTYYRHWLTALERLLAARGIAEPADLRGREAAFARAARATPHGEPVRLDNDPVRRLSLRLR